MPWAHRELPVRAPAADRGHHRQPSNDPGGGQNRLLVYQGPRTARGYHAGVLVSADGGATWRVSLSLRGSANLVSNASFVGPRDGWIVWITNRDLHQWRCTLLRTQDGGASWHWLRPLSGAAALPADSMQFVSTRVGYTFNSVDGRVWRTSDAGSSWRASSVSSLSWDGSFALDDRNVWVSMKWYPQEGDAADDLGGGLYSSSDGGITWRQPSHAFDDIAVEDVYFASRRVGWVAGTDPAWDNVIYATRDGGRHWVEDVVLGQIGSFEGFLKVGREAVAWVSPKKPWNRTRSYYLYDLGQLPVS